MTKEKAKEVSTKIWEYLRDNPTIKDKIELPKEYFNLIKDYFCNCALCEYDFQKGGIECGCETCPIVVTDGRHTACTLYFKWSESKTKKERAYYANEIVERIKAW